MTVLSKRLFHPLGLLLGLLLHAGCFPGVAVSQNDLLVAAPNRNSVERFDATTGDYLGSFVTGGSGGLTRPGAVAVGPDGNVYVTSNQRVLRYDGATGDFIDVFSTGNGMVAANNLLFFGDHMYVGQFAAGANGIIKRFDAGTGDFVDNFIDSPFVDGFIFGSDSVLVSNFFGGVSRFDINTGEFVEEFIGANDGGLINPTALLLLSNDDLLVSSYETDSVKRFSSDGVFLGDVITGLPNPEGLVIGPNGNLFAGSYTQGVINEYDSETFELIGEFANSGPVTNFFTFRATAIPEPTAAIPLLFGSAAALLGRRRRPRVSAVAPKKLARKKLASK